jgi:hypothetical protein
MRPNNLINSSLFILNIAVSLNNKIRVMARDYSGHKCLFRECYWL